MRASADNEKWPDSGDISETWAIGLPDELDKGLRGKVASGMAPQEGEKFLSKGRLSRGLP